MTHTAPSSTPQHSANAADRILVAVDGSEPASRALQWAAHDAAQRGVGLTIMHCYDLPPSSLAAMGAIDSLLPALEKDSSGIVAAAAEAARSIAPDLPIETRSQIGPAAPTIVGWSENYGSVVVGSRGRGGFSGMLLGSVGTTVISHAACPATVVRGDVEAGTNAPIVVGVDDSDAGQAALRQAFAAADRRGANLLAVHALDGPADAGAHGSDPDSAFEKWRAAADHELTEQLAAVTADYPAVRTATETTLERPATALLRCAQSAQLVVVGTRGRGAIASAVLGSTSRALALHAPCPVTVVPDPARDASSA